ncbi:MAG: HesB/IscA family protein [Candidatus Krumholzibacteriia bacterium]
MIILTANAMTEVRLRLDSQGAVDRTVRIHTRQGGCAGTKYVVEIGVPPAAGDLDRLQEGIRILYPADQEHLLDGLRLDHLEALMGGGFKFANPNAGSTCGCGDSFKPLQDPGRPGS